MQGGKLNFDINNANTFNIILFLLLSIKNKCAVNENIFAYR